MARAPPSGDSNAGPSRASGPGKMLIFALAVLALLAPGSAVEPDAAPQAVLAPGSAVEPDAAPSLAEMLRAAHLSGPRRLQANSPPFWRTPINSTARVADLALAGEIATMPGLPKTPSAIGIHLNSEGRIEGLS